MIFREHIPDKPLSDHILHMWYLKTNLDHPREKVLPSGTMELIINLGDRHKVLDKNNFDKYATYNHSFISGTLKEYIVIEPTGNSHMIGMRFKPGGAFPYFKLPLSELTDKVIEMEYIWGTFVREAREKILEEKSIPGKFRILENMLIARANGDFQIHSAVNHAVDIIRNSVTPVKIRDLAEKIGYTQKHLINLFKNTVGISPKTYQKIHKFHSIISNLESRTLRNLTEFAAEYYYYDQAHFIKDFRNFTGITPGEYLATYDSDYPDFIPLYD